MNVVLKYCCCSGEDDEGLPYRPLGSDVQPVRSVPRGRGNGVENGGADFTDHATPPPAPRKTREQEERDALDNILETTQHSIIEVGHGENQKLEANELINRQRKYTEMIRVHDVELSNDPQNRTDFPEALLSVRLASGVQVPIQPERVYYYKMPSGDRIMTRATKSSPEQKNPPAAMIPSPAFLQMLESGAHEVSNACKAVAIEHKTDLVVSMDF